MCFFLLFLSSQFLNFLIVSAVLQVTLAATKIQEAGQRPTRGTKDKRNLYRYEDNFYGPPPPIPQQVHYSHGSPYAPPSRPSLNTNIFGFDAITYQSLFNELNGIHYNVPTHMTPPPQNSPGLFSNGYGYVNYGLPHNYDQTYIAHDGRILKQYSVHERHVDDIPDTRTFQPNPTLATQQIPSGLPPFYVSSNLNLAQPRAQVINNNQIPTFLNRNHGPIALGSGSLGYITLPNGNVFLGSGSLGYTSHKQHYDMILEISNRKRKSLQPGLTTFGHSH